jgi:hypothetical protein
MCDDFAVFCVALDDAWRHPGAIRDLAQTLGRWGRHWGEGGDTGKMGETLGRWGDTGEMGETLES